MPGFANATATNRVDLSSRRSGVTTERGARPLPRYSTMNTGINRDVLDW
jgi:hypothetical protein